MIILFLDGCSMMVLNENPDHLVNVDFTPAASLLLIVNSAVYPALQQDILQYQSDLEHLSIHVAVWEGGTAADLKAMIRAYRGDYAIGGVFLVGDFPAVWYEMRAFGRDEQFPCDLYFMDLEATWQDKNANGILDAHSQLNLAIFISRIAGTETQLHEYFGKLHRYRTGQLALPASAYIFKDDDWRDYCKGSSFGLKEIYPHINLVESLSATIRSNYLDTLGQGGSEFIYQWIHANPCTLAIRNDTVYQAVSLSDVATYNLQGLFYNLYNCSAARFTQNNLAMTYLLQTDYALATLGSTKVGGNFFPASFYSALYRNGTWGDAYMVWYNSYGRSDDEWFLGMVILGDPCLTISQTAPPLMLYGAAPPQPPSAEEIEGLKKNFETYDSLDTPQSFTDYRQQNPDFFVP